MAGLRIGVLGAAKITPKALMKPARRNDEVESSPSRRATAPRPSSSPQARHPHGPRLLRRAARRPDDRRDLQPAAQRAARQVDDRRARRRASTCCARSRSPPTPTKPRRWRRSRRATGLVVMEAFHYRYHPLAQRLRRDRATSGELGTVEHIETWMCIPLLPKRRHPLAARPRRRIDDGRRLLRDPPRCGRSAAGRARGRSARRAKRGLPASTSGSEPT